jgi:DNA-binding NtrC family response regulator
MVILLVEDDLNVQFLTWKLLKAEGFTVLNADSAESALETSRNYLGSIDLLLSDVAMPRMDGLELGENISAERPEIKVLMMSGDLRHRERACMNSLPFLQKPFTPTTLRDSIAGLLGPVGPAMAASVQSSA